MQITLKDILLFILLLTVSYKDLTERRIPNKITFPAILLGWGLGLVAGGLTGLLQSFLGTLTGIAVFFIPFALEGMGAGDVKLLAAIGALMGWKFTLLSALYSSLAGLVMSVFALLAKGKFKNMINNLIYILLTGILKLINLTPLYSQSLFNLQKKYSDKRQSYEKTYIPYGVAISIGALLVFINNYIKFLPL